MSFLTANHSSKGGRELNEDTVYAAQTEGAFIALVADGLGMHGGGDIASRTAVQTLSQCFLKKPSLDVKEISCYFEEANRAILIQQTASCQMKSTIAALLFYQKQFLFAHLGDSRLYYFRNGRIVFQTIDHSVSQMAVLAGEINASQIRFHEDRNRVLRALGNEEQKCPDFFAPADPVRDGDAFLLCTDGFWEFVLESEMELDLAKSDIPEQWLSFLLARIGKRINGKNDNISVIAVIYHEH